MGLVLLTNEQREKRNYLKRAGSPGNATLNQRTLPGDRSIRYRLGYNTITAVYSKSNDIEVYSGSSYNRAINKRIKDEHKQEIERFKAEQGFDCKKDERSDAVIETSLRALRAVEIDKQKFKNRNPKPLSERGLPIHFISQRSKGKIRDKCTALHRCLGKNKTFATLTFINDISDSVGIKILNKFFTAIRERLGRIHYIWVAERQEKTTGRIHFHVILNKFLPIREFNALWVLQQYNEGIEDLRFTRSDIVKMINHDEENPGKKSELKKYLNPLDVKPITSIYNLSWYLTKYITKGNNKGGFECASWHCSRAVSRLFTKVVASRSTFNLANSPQNCSRSLDGVITKKDPIIQKYSAVYFIENKLMFLDEMRDLEELNLSIIEERWSPPDSLIVDALKIATHLN
jgi:hypothetical protein